MGTHPKGPSLIASSGESLAKWIADHHSSLGDQAKFYNELPFLFKVLSVNIALSIQVHPDKVRALHCSLISSAVNRLDSLIDMLSFILYTSFHFDVFLFVILTLICYNRTM